ncbi:unnamed protein product, partial [marine sediment metagenome]
TKGKWIIAGDEIVSEEFNEVIVTSMHDNCIPRVDESNANLKLIVAAPKLLAACKECLNLMESTLEYDGESIRENNYKFLVEAIAKAEE